MATQLEINQVTALYEDILFRAPDSGGLAYWSGILDSGLLDLQELISIFTNSAEVESNVDPIVRLYLGLLGRAPDAPGLTGWVGAIESGTSFQQIVSDFLSTQEFANDYNGGVIGPIPQSNATAFVTSLYLHILGRLPDAAGLTSWVNVLDNGNNTAPTIASETAVVIGFINSQEYINDTQNGIISWETSGALSALADTTASTVGTATFPDTITNTAFTIYLTGAVETISSGINVVGSLTNDETQTPTLVPGDTIANIVTLTLVDAYGYGSDLIPQGVTLENIQNVVLNTNGNAGDDGVFFNVSGISNLQTVTVNSQGDYTDLVQAGPTTAITIDHGNSNSYDPEYYVDVIAIGGSSVTITDAGDGGVVVGKDLGTGCDSYETPVASDLPTGAVSIEDTGGYGDIEVLGGTSVTVTATSDSYYGDIYIGNDYYNTGGTVSGAIADPTGAITVTDDSEGNSDIYVYGGTSVTITASGDYIDVGSDEPESPSDNPSGDVTISNEAQYTWTDSNSNSYGEDIYVYGGNNVTITTNNGEYIEIGGTEANATDTGVLAGTDPAGNVTVTDTASATDGPRYDIDIDINGGNNVTVTASGAFIHIGHTEYGPNDEPAYSTGPAGNVTVSDVAALALTGIETIGQDMFVQGFWGDITVDGGQNINITTNTGSVRVGTSEGYNDTTGAVVANGEPSGTVTVVDSSTLGWAKVEVYGGTDVSVNSSGTQVIIGETEDYTPPGTNTSEVPFTIAPSGNITVSDEAPIAYDSIVNDFDAGVSIVGGENVTVATNAGYVDVGGDEPFTNPSSEPTGTVTVTDTATGLWDNESVVVYGGTTVSVSAADGSVDIGDFENGVFSVTGNVTVDVTGIQTGSEYHNGIDIDAGGNVVINTTGQTGIEVLGSPTSTITITDTHSGFDHHSDDISVYGGSTVVINAGLLNGGSDVDVGAEPETNAAGTAYTNLAEDPTGNVTINQSATYGSVTDYGHAYDDVYVDGATTVTLVGGSGATIEDVNSLTIPDGPDAGDLVGTPTLTTVNLTGVDGNVSITADALANLNITDNPADPDVFIYTYVPTSALTITLNNAFTFVEDEEDDYTGTVTIATAGTAADGISLEFEVAKSLVFDNVTPLFLSDSDLDAVTTIAAQGSAFLDLGDLTDTAGFPESSFAPDVKSVTVTGTGPVYVQLNPADTSFTGDATAGGGNNEVVITSNPSTTTAFWNGNTLDGGSGSANILYAQYASSGTDVALLNDPSQITNFQDLGVAGHADGTYDATNAAGLIVGIYNYYGGDYDGVAGPITFTNVAQSTPLDIIDGSDETITYTLKTAFTMPGSVSITMGQDADAAAGITAATGFNEATVVLTGDNIGTVNIDSQGTPASQIHFNELAVTDADLAITSLVVTGDADLVLFEEDGTITNLDTAGMTSTTGANPAVNAVSVEPAAAGFTVTSGTFFIEVNAEWDNTAGTTVNTYNIGAGGGDIEVGGGGAGNQIGQYDPSGNTGSETINLTATAPNGTTVILPQFPIDGNTADGVGAIINDWTQGTIANGQTANTLEVGATDLNLTAAVAPVVIANASNVAGINGEHYNIADGVFTLTAPDATLTGEEEVNDVQHILDNGAPPDGTIAMVTDVPLTGGPFSEGTFVLMYDGGGSKDTIVEITGLTGVTGFGVTVDPEYTIDPADYGAGTSVNVVTDDYGALFANVSKNNMGSATANETYNDAGYSLDTLDNSGPGFTNTYSNLGNWALLEGGDSIAGGNVVVTQAGIDPIVTFIANFNSTINNLTYGNATVAHDDPLLTLDAVGGEIILNSLTDASNTATTIAITSEGNDNEVDIGAISDTALTTINGSGAANVDLFSEPFTGDLVLGSEPAPIAQAGLTITAAQFADGGGATIFASGAGDTITVGNIAAHDVEDEPVIVQAAGAGDHISVDMDVGTPGGIIGAAGAGDTLTLVGGNGTNPGEATESGGTIEGVVSAAGTKDSAYDIAYDTLGGSSGTSSLSAPPHGDTPVGANATINIGDPTGENDTTAIVWLGENSTVNITEGPVGGPSADTTADLWLTGDVTGATSAGAYAQETINWNGGALNLYFFNATTEGWAGGSATDSFVNVATATSIGNALDIAAGDVTTLNANFDDHDNIVVPTGGPAELAAKTGLVDWFEYGGNTYVVEAINSGTTAATHTALGTGDVVVELVGLHNLDITGGFHFA